MNKVISGVTVECITGDIASQEDITAVVNAANAWLKPGGGVAGAIHSKAGPGLAEECSQYAPINPGEAVITSGHNLPNYYVIHCLGPVYGVDKPENELLANCYRNALKLCEKHRVESVAFPALSTGAFRYPLKEAAGIAVETIKEMIPHIQHVKLIRFVLFDDKSFQVYENLLKNNEEKS